MTFSFHAGLTINPPLQGRIYSKRGSCLHPTLSGPTCTAVIIDILLRTRAAMHATIAAAAGWQFEASLSEANCKRVREYWSNTYMLKNGQSPQKGLLPCCKKWKKIVFLWGPLFVEVPVRPNMLNMPTSASAQVTYTTSRMGRDNKY